MRLYLIACAFINPNFRLHNSATCAVEHTRLKGRPLTHSTVLHLVKRRRRTNMCGGQFSDRNEFILCLQSWHYYNEMFMCKFIFIVLCIIIWRQVDNNK